MTYIEIAQDHIERLYPTIIYAKPPIRDLPPGAIIGTWQYSIPGTARFILNRDVEIAAGVLPSDLARAWVKTEYNLPIRRRRAQMVRGYPVALHARRGLHGDCSYVDIKSAYLHILTMGYDLEYRQGKYLSAAPHPVPDEIKKHKFAYSIAVAMSGTVLSNITVMGKDGTFAHRPMNVFSNPCLFNLAQDTLNGIGAEILAALGDNCVYINTDGYIIKAGYEHDAMEIIRNWGFDCRIKASGETEVRGVASYKVGETQTSRFDARANDFTGKLMEKTEYDWLRDKWSRWTGKFTSIFKSEQNSYKFEPSGLQPEYYAL